MAGKALELALILRARDEATRPVSRAMRDITRETQAASRGAMALGKSVDQLNRGRRFRLIDDMKLLDRTITGVRRSMDALARGSRAIASVGAGVAAASYVAGQPVKRTMDYDLRLAYLSNTAFAGRDLAGRQAGMRELDAAVKGAVRFGGGSRDQAADALDAMIASGALSVDQSTKILPSLMRAATGSGADPTELAQIGIRGMQTFGIRAEDMPRVFDMAMAAGQAGGFELRDMARWLPQQMAAARQAGMSGLAGLTDLLAANQAAAITAGTKDEAGNNLVNLLAKANASDTAQDFKKLGIDLTGSLAAKRGRGLSGLDAFLELVDEVAARDKRFVAARKAAAAATGSERGALLESQADLLQGSAIGKVVQDRQALMALVALLNNREYVGQVRGAVAGSTGTVERAAALIESTPSFQTGRLGAEKAFAESDAVGGFAKVLGDAAGKLADYAQRYPALASALTGATTALTALAAAATAAGAVGLLSKGGAVAAAGAAAAAGGAKVFSGMRAGAAMLFGAGSLSEIGMMGSSALATAGGLGLVASGLGFGAGYGINKLAQGTDFMDWMDSAIAKPIADAIDTVLGKEVNVAVTVDVKGGNIVAEVNKANSREAKRY
jgi:hypothetical protein